MFDTIRGVLRYMKRNDPCWCGSGKKYKKCHEDYDERIAEMRFDVFRGQVRPPHKLINNEKDIEGIKAAAVINNGALDLMTDMVKPGITTAELDHAVYEYIIGHGGIPGDLNYEGFPASCCTSINDIVCHGIPSKKVHLKEGDIVNIDITTILNGYYADASRMYIVGKAAPNAERLVRVTQECMNLGIEAAKPWHFVGDIGAACGKHARENGYGVVTDLGGHGVGKGYHIEPFVSHDAEAGTGMLLVPGMTLTVEPMINEGKKDVYTDKSGDGWTVRTKDHKLSAQWEKTILITETGAEVISS